MATWNPADNYDPDAFYTEGTDKKGMGEKLSIRVPPRVARGIAELIQSGKIPQYKTTSDFVRNAIVHQLHKDAERIQDEGLRKVVSMTTLLNTVISRAREKDDYHQLMSHIETEYADLLGAGKAEQAKQYIKNMLAKMDALPERFWEDYERRLNQKLYPI